MRNFVLAALAATTLCGAANSAEVLTVPFTQVDAAITQDLYSGLVYIEVSGIGQSKGTTYNDAFYLLPDGTLSVNQTGYYQLGFSSTTLTPSNQNEAAYNYILGGRPAYNNATHSYSFLLDTRLTTPGALHFNVTDGNYSDNTGSFSLTISQAPEPASWAMMVGGFGLIGFAMRRRDTAGSFA